MASGLGVRGGAHGDRDTPARRSVPLLAGPRAPPHLHVSPRVGHPDRREPLALGGARPARLRRAVGGRDRRRRARPPDCLALAAGCATSRMRAPSASRPAAGRARYRGEGPSELRPAGGDAPATRSATLLGRGGDRQVREDLRRFKQQWKRARWRRAAPATCGRTGGAEMRAVCWHGRRDVRVEQVPDPQILNPRDAIVRVTSTAICGSDLHLYNGFIPTMQRGRHPGPRVHGRGRRGRAGRDGTSRVATASWCPFPIACGSCCFCREGLTSLCDNTNPNAEMAEALYGFSGAGLFGYSHLFGGYAGGQAEYVRVPFADVGPLKRARRPPSDEQVLFLSDIFPTGYMAAENCDIRPGDIVAVWGCGPVGQFAISAAPAPRRRARHRASTAWPERLRLAESAGQGRDASTTRRRRRRRGAQAA